jgi:hypothetical protein
MDGLSRKVVAGLGLCALTYSMVADAQYSVQIAAYARPDSARLDTAQRIGTVHSHVTSKGITRFLVGPYATRDEARSALRMLREAGYADAFVRADGAATGTAMVRETVSAPLSDPSSVRSGPNASSWSHLSDEIRSKIVILDGQPHVKEGDRFIALAEYLKRSR